MNTLKRYLCLFLVIALLFTSGFAPFVTVIATEISPDADAGTNTGDASDADANTSTDDAPDADTDTSTGAAPDADTDTSTGAAPDTDTDTSTDAAPDADTDTSTGAAPDADTDTSTDDAPDTDAENHTDDAPDADTDTSTDDAPDADTDTSTGDAPDTDAENHTDNAPDADTDTSADDAPDADTDTSTGAAPDADTDTSTGAAPDADTDTSTGAAPDTDTDTSTGDAPDADAGYTYSFKDSAIEVTAEISPDSVFSQDETELNNDEIHLEADTTEDGRFSQLFEDYEGETLTLDLSFRTEDGETVEQVNGSTELTLTISGTDENAAIHNVEVYHYAPGAEDEPGAVEQVEEISVDSEAHTVSFNAEELGAYAVRYTVDFYFEGREFHMVGGATLLLSELFLQLGVDRDAADVERIDFTDNRLIQFTRYDDRVDWVIKSLAPFDTQETLTLIFADGERLVIPVTDDQTVYSDTSNLADLMVNWKITVGDMVFSDDTVDEHTEITYKEGMQYSLELSFAEKPTLGFSTPETDPPEMFYQLPDLFYVPPDFTVPLIVKLGRKGVLADNIVSIAEGSISGGTVHENKLITGGTFSTDADANGKKHSFLKLKWNWQDTAHWGYFRDSSQANLKIIVNGVFQDEEPHVLSINGKDIKISKEDLHNAIVNKAGKYDPLRCVIDYTVTVTSQGTTSDITLTDAPGSALTYNGDVTFDADASINKANTAPRITPKTGNTFNVVIPAMQDGDSLVFRYSSKVDYDGIAISGAPTFEETGNTAQIVGDSYTPDNIATYHEMSIEFSDLEKNCVNKRKRTIAGNLSYILTWEIDTNKRAMYPLADTTITDTISPDIQDISKYTGSGVTVECYSEDNQLCETRRLNWADLGVNLDSSITWTYHIPDTDPPYRYKLTYDTIVDMSSQTETIVAENTAEGKGGIDSDRAVLPPPGRGIGVTKKATDIGSTHVTWEITLTVSGDAFDSERLALTEHCDVEGDRWQADGFPIRWMIKPGDTEYTIYRESLKKVEVVGLEAEETFKVTYGPSNALTLYPSEPGQSVLEGFADTMETRSRDFFQLEFFKDSAGTVGNLIRPDGENPSRTIVVRLTMEFPTEWAQTARDITLNTTTRSTYNYSHINWISADTPDTKGNLISRARDTDKFLIIPAQVYKSVLENADTTLPAATPERYLLNYPDCHLEAWNGTTTGAAYPDDAAFPAFRYMAIVSGVQFDEPLVIEDKFDTSLFELITTDSFPGGQYVMTKNSRQWTHGYFLKVFGISEFSGSAKTDDANYNRASFSSLLYGFGYNNTNYYRKAEDNGCVLEKTDTGFRVTMNELPKRPDGNLFPFYGIDYWLVPKSLEALKQIEETAARNGRNGKEAKAPYVNTVSARGTSASATVKVGVTNDFMPLDKTSETWLELTDSTRKQLVDTVNGNQTVRDTDEPVRPDEISRYVMKYRIVLNKGKERLNEGNPITAEDEYSSNLSVDFNSISITTTPEEAASKVSYDFSGNIGYFTIPDETKVVIEYEATILQTAEAADNVNVSNEVRMLQYKKGLDDYIRHGGAGGSTASNPGILVKKYGTGHMEKGLNGAVFQLFKYKHASYTRGDSNTATDWTPIVLPKSGGRAATFTTRHLEGYGDGYAEIELSQERDGMTLTPGTVYGLREITTPVGVAANGDKINYQNPHTDTFFCYIFSICEDGETANYNNFVYLPDDTMTIRNTPESVSLNIQKRLDGNCTLSDAETKELTYQVFRKEIPVGADEGQSAVYMPILKAVTDASGHENASGDDSGSGSGDNSGSGDDSGSGSGDDSGSGDNSGSGSGDNSGSGNGDNSGSGNGNDSGNGDDSGSGNSDDKFDPRFMNIKYNQVSGGWDINGLTAGDYLLVEYGNGAITEAHPDWNWRGVYEWSDGTSGNFTHSKYPVYDETGANERTVCGIPFTVTSQEIKDGEGKSVTLTNAYTRETVNLTAVKQWTGPSGAPVAWPSGKSVVFTLGTLDADGTFTAVSEVSPITLDNKKDADGEELPGYATFKNLPKYRVVGDGDEKKLEIIRYAARESASVTGYDVMYPVEGRNYAAFGDETSVKVKNQMKATSISVFKKWDRDSIPENAKAVFRLFSYTGDDPSKAVWMSTINDIPLDGVPDDGTDTFGEKTAWQADFTGLPMYDSDGKTLNYIVREIACTPADYEPMEEYAAAGKTITNRPAAVDFTVRKAWSGTPGDAWPDGVLITLELSRKTRSGVKDETFSASYILSSSAITSQTAIVDNYGESRQTGTLSDDHTLTVSDLPKCDANGNQWLYYVTETKIRKPNNGNDYDDISDKYYKEYRDKNHYKVSGAFTYSGGSITNALTSITVSKTVTGNMGEKSRDFHFTLTLKDGDANFNQFVEYQKTTKSGDVKEYVTFENGVTTFTLKHGERIKFCELPRNLSYTVTESDDDAFGYETTLTVNGWDEENSHSVSGNLSDNPVVAFVNRKDVIIPTGVSSNAPAWLCLTWLSGVLSLSLWARRRRNKGDFPGK